MKRRYLAPRDVPPEPINAAWQQRTMTDVRLDAYDRGLTVNAFGFPVEG